MFHLKLKVQNVIVCIILLLTLIPLCWALPAVALTQGPSQNPGASQRFDSSSFFNGYRSIASLTDFSSFLPSLSPLSSEDEDSIYQERVVHNPDGIGKFYMGREIAQVMGHLGAGWLERPTRELEEQPEELIKGLKLRPTDLVADIGAGTGYFSVRISSLVPQGKVLAVDIQPEMLEIIEAVKQEKHIDNVEPVLGTDTTPILNPIALI